MKTLTASQTRKFQFDFPAEFAAEREQMITAILRFMAEDTQESVQEACRMQSSWLDQYPNDYGMLDLGESLWMLADAIAFVAEQGIEPLKRVEVTTEMGAGKKNGRGGNTRGVFLPRVFPS